MTRGAADHPPARPPAVDVPHGSMDGRTGSSPAAFRNANTMEMNSTQIRKVTRRNGWELLSLVAALAAYEKLRPPDRAAKRRLLADCSGPARRFDAYLAGREGKAAGYALVFETYSSFNALPALYLEDLFVLPTHRDRGIGRDLFDFCVKEAKRRGCCRLEWVVLDWNTGAKKFYRKLGAKALSSWEHYRLDINRRI